MDLHYINFKKSYTVVPYIASVLKKKLQTPLYQFIFLNSKKSDSRKSQ